MNTATPASPQMLAQIVQSAADAYSLDAGRLISRIRGNQTVCNARHLAIHVICQTTDMDLHKVARIFGKMSYEGIKSALQSADAKLQHDEDFRNRANSILDQLP